MTQLDILQPYIIHGRPRAIRTLTKRAKLFYCTKDSLSNENKRWPSLFFLRKTTKTTTLDKTDKDPLGPLSVRLFDRTNHLFICTKLCRLNNYFSSYYVFHICSVKLICKDNSELLILNGAISDWGISSNGRAPALHAGGTGIDTRILQLVRLIFCLFFGKILPYKVLTKHLFCKLQHLFI